MSEYIISNDNDRKKLTEAIKYVDKITSFELANEFSAQMYKGDGGIENLVVKIFSTYRTSDYSIIGSYKHSLYNAVNSYDTCELLLKKGRKPAKTLPDINEKVIGCLTKLLELTPDKLNDLENLRNEKFFEILAELKTNQDKYGGNTQNIKVDWQERSTVTICATNDYPTGTIDVSKSGGEGISLIRGFVDDFGGTYTVATDDNQYKTTITIPWTGVDDFWLDFQELEDLGYSI